MLTLRKGITSDEWNTVVEWFREIGDLKDDDEYFLTCAQELVEGLILESEKYNSEEEPFLGIVFNGKIIGYTWMTHYDLYDYSVIMYIWIHPKFRRSGIASNVIKLLANYTENKQIRAMTPTEKGQNLFLSLGFKWDKNRMDMVIDKRAINCNIVDI